MLKEKEKLYGLQYFFYFQRERSVTGKKNKSEQENEAKNMRKIQREKQ